MFRKKIIVISGGLGNQLFQFSFAHTLASNNRRNVLVYSPKPKNEARDFALNSLCGECTHIQKVVLKRSSSIDFLFKFRDFLIFRFEGQFRTVLERFFYTEPNAYDYSVPLFTEKFYSGYFQNWRFVQEEFPLIQAELANALSTHSLPISFQTINQPYGVIHFRRGDLIKFSQSMGVLEDSFFLGALDLALRDNGERIKVIVLTDDKELGVHTFSGVVDEIYGPAEIDEWQGLRLMSQAAFVITSNSTFSWWGGFLASKNGATVYIPSPWFSNWTPDPGSAFEYPGFKKIPSKFKGVI